MIQKVASRAFGRRFVAVTAVAIALSSGIAMANIASAQDCSDDPARPPDQPACSVSSVEVTVVNDTAQAATFTINQIEITIGGFDRQRIGQVVGELVGTVAVETYTPAGIRFAPALTNTTCTVTADPISTGVLAINTGCS